MRHLTFAFETSGEAYDASQTNEAIKDGDLLVVQSEQCVAILVSAWPAAAFGGSAESAFHPVNAEGFADEASAWLAMDGGKYAASYVAAQEVMNEDGSLTLVGKQAVRHSESVMLGMRVAEMMQYRDDGLHGVADGMNESLMDEYLASDANGRMQPGQWMDQAFFTYEEASER